MKKSTMLACAGIVIVSFSPFLGGCASTNVAPEPTTASITQESEAEPAFAYEDANTTITPNAINLGTE